MKISRFDLKNNYGIDLPNGKYNIERDGDNYVIYTVKDDTEGCVLVGRNTVVGRVMESRSTFRLLMREHLNKARARNEKVYITIE